MACAISSIETMAAGQAKACAASPRGMAVTDAERGAILRAVGAECTTGRVGPMQLLMTVRAFRRATTETELRRELQRLKALGCVNLAWERAIEYEWRVTITAVWPTPYGWALIRSGRNPAPMGELAALSRQKCTVCAGTGWIEPYGTQLKACQCVYRGVFDFCRGRYGRIRDGGSMGYVVLEAVVGGLSASMYGAEYMADFELAAGRALAAHPLERAALNSWLAGMSGTECQKSLEEQGMEADHDAYWRAVGKMKALVGRECLQSGILPREYFRPRRAVAMQMPQNARVGLAYCAGEPGEAIAI
jgi:hypothetical protein